MHIGSKCYVLFNYRVYRGSILDENIDRNQYLVRILDNSGKDFSIWFDKEYIFNGTVSDSYELHLNDLVGVEVEVEPGIYKTRAGIVISIRSNNKAYVMLTGANRISQRDSLPYSDIAVVDKSRKVIRVFRDDKNSIEGKVYNWNKYSRGIACDYFATLSNSTAGEIIYEYLELKNIENSCTIQTCKSCDKKVLIHSMVISDHRGHQFLTNDKSTGNLSIETYCSECAHHSKFNCKLCDKDYLILNKAGKYMAYRDATIIEKNGSICLSCSSKMVLCRLCSDLEFDKSLEINGEVHCKHCSEDVIREFYRVPQRAINPGSHKKSNSFKRNKFRRNVGVEIECVHDWEGLSIPRGWRIVGDTSIDDEDFGSEYVMKFPTNGDTLLNDIERLTNMISNTGGYVNNSCGLHIHVNALDMQLEEMKNCLALGYILEKWIFNMLPKNREGNTYCKPLPNINTNSLLNIKTLRDYTELWYKTISNTSVDDTKYNDSRYRGLNIHSRIVHGTIEFRYHHSTFNMHEIENWISLCLSIVENSFNINKNLKDIIIDSSDVTPKEFFYYLGIPEFYQYYMEQSMIY